MLLENVLMLPSKNVLTYIRSAIHTQPQDGSYTKIVEYKTGIVKPFDFPDLGISLDRVLLY